MSNAQEACEPRYLVAAGTGLKVAVRQVQLIHAERTQRLVVCVCVGHRGTLLRPAGPAVLTGGRGGRRE